VICRAFGGVYWRLVKTFLYICVRRCLLPVRGVILNPLVIAVQFTLHSVFV